MSSTTKSKVNLETINPSEILEKINILNNKYELLLKEFKENYINYQSNQDSDEYKNILNAKISQLQSAHDECMKLTSDSQNAIKQYENSVKNRVDELSENRDEYDELHMLLKNAKDNQRSSNVLVHNYNANYNNIYYKNIFLICGIFLITLLIFKYNADESSEGNGNILIIFLLVMFIIFFLSKYVSFHF